MHVSILLIVNYPILFPWYFAMATGRCEKTLDVSPFLMWDCFVELVSLKGQGHNQKTPTQWQFQSHLHVAIPVLFKVLLAIALL